MKLALTLNVLTHHHRLLGSKRRLVLYGKGCNIGRSRSNDLVLPDRHRYISKQHARIEHRDGHYYLLDTSANGVYLNSNARPVGRGYRVELHDGDILHIGDYQILSHFSLEDVQTDTYDPELDTTLSPQSATTGTKITPSG